MHQQHPTDADLAAAFEAHADEALALVRQAAAAPDRRVIQCNIAVGTKTAVQGARCYVLWLNPGWDNERLSLLIRSRSGRWIQKWERIENLTGFRVKTIPPEHPLYRDVRLVDRGGCADKDVVELLASKARADRREAAKTEA
jgi:hypothetical protein